MRAHLSFPSLSTLRPAGQKQLEDFRTEMATKVNDNYAVLLKSKKLPLALLQDEDKARDGGPARSLARRAHTRAARAPPAPPAG